MKRSKLNLIKSTLLLLVTLPLIYSCGSTKQGTMTRPLFMQSKRANIQLPYQAENSKEGSQTITEEVTFQHADNTSDLLEEQAKPKSISDIQHLDGLVVTAKARFTPERNGKVNLNFLVNVPKELLSENWALTLTPELLHNDSVVELDDVIIKGQVFDYKQKDDAKEFEKYANSIVDVEDYGKKFVNKKLVEKDINKQQKEYWKLYRKEWKSQDKYLAWRNMMKSRYDEANLKHDAALTKDFHKYERERREEATQLLMNNRDTTGIYNKYMRKYESHIKSAPVYRIERTFSMDKTPGRHKKYLQEDIRLEDINNYIVSKQDSLEITSNRYLFDKIAKNEQKIANKESVYAKLVPFPIKTDMKIDTVIRGNKDFTYLYELEYPVVSGLNSLRIAMSGEIQAVDLSSYTLAPSDTLSYFISSLVQLVDTSLIRKEVKIYKNMYSRHSFYPKFSTNQPQFNTSFSDNTKQVEDLNRIYNNIVNEKGVQIDSIQIKALSLQDGPFDFNDNLSYSRLQSLTSQLNDKAFKGLANANNLVSSGLSGNVWQELIKSIRESQSLNNKESILKVLLNSVNHKNAEQTLRSDYPADYKLITELFNKDLQKVDVIFNMSRPGMTKADSIQSNYSPEYEEGVRLLQNREYWKAMEKLKNYPDYNTALCLACMGYNGRAYDLLITLDQNANTEYLTALMLIRLKREGEAIDHLLKACEFDANKVDRASLDPEIADLIQKHNLGEQLDQIYYQTDVIDWDAIERITDEH